MENEYLMEQQSMLSKSATLNEMLSFKKELERSERKREQLTERLEVCFTFYNKFMFCIVRKFSH